MNTEQVELFGREQQFLLPQGRKLALVDWLKQYVIGTERMICLGTDSQNTSRTNFTTAVVAYLPRRGGVYCYRRYHRPRINELRLRLSIECWNSIYLALLIEELVKELHGKNKIVVHLDVSTNLEFQRKPAKCKSGQYMQELVSTVVAQGFPCEVKPKAFATTVADSLVKGKFV